MSKCSPYISCASITIGCGTPRAIGCAGRDGPDQLALAGVAPAQAAARAEQAAEGLGEWPECRDEQAHPAQDGDLHAVDDGVGDLLVRDVAPPDEHVGGVEDLLGQPVFGDLQRRGADLGAEQLAQPAAIAASSRRGRSRGPAGRGPRARSRPRP